MARVPLAGTDWIPGSMAFSHPSGRAPLRGWRRIFPIGQQNGRGSERMTTDLAKVAAERGIKYFLISFVDLFGTMRAKLVPAVAIDDMAKAGAGFAGFATWLDMTPADPDMLAMPDADSLIQLPWKPEVGWVAADPYMDGKLVEQAPRNVLKSVLDAAAAKGYEMKTGVECEFFLICARRHRHLRRGRSPSRSPATTSRR